MSLDKAIFHGKEKRKPYTGAKAIAKSCRNHGSCSWCRENRLHKFRDRKPAEEMDDLWEMDAGDDWMLFSDVVDNEAQGE